MVMERWRWAGGALAFLTCPVHLPFYLMWIAELGLRREIAVGFVLPTLVLGFIGGLFICVWPEDQNFWGAQAETP